MRLGFIGCGNMAGAIIAGIIKKGLVSPDEIYGSNSTPEHANATHERLGIQTTTDNTLVAGESDIVFLCVKPQQYEAVIDQVKDHLHERQILVSIAPGKTLAWLGEKIGHPQKIVRVMPNTPALVGEGTTAFCPGDLVSLAEPLMDAASAVGGSAPAFVYMFIEALADGGVAEGLPRAQAQMIAAQTVLGSAKMVLETGEHPGKLKDQVCSPGGSTIAGVEALEEGAFRGTTTHAVRATVAKARSL